MAAASDSKVIPGQRITCERWQLPQVEAAGAAGKQRGTASAAPLTASQLKALQKEAYDEAYQRGFERGREDGAAAVVAENRSLGECLHEGLRCLAAPLAELDQEVEESLVQLAMAVARQLVRRELRTDPGQVVAIVRESLSALPVAARNVRLHLHPEDIPLVKKASNAGDDEIPWRFTSDPLITRGGCRIESESSRIDATVEARLARVIAHVMGGERAADEL